MAKKQKTKLALSSVILVLIIGNIFFLRPVSPIPNEFEDASKITLQFISASKEMAETALCRQASIPFGSEPATKLYGLLKEQKYRYTYKQLLGAVFGISPTLTTHGGKSVADITFWNDDELLGSILVSEEGKVLIDKHLYALKRNSNQNQPKILATVLEIIGDSVGQ